jgi:hypothetical protein
LSPSTGKEDETGGRQIKCKNGQIEEIAGGLHAKVAHRFGNILRKKNGGTHMRKIQTIKSNNVNISTY